MSQGKRVPSVPSVGATTIVTMKAHTLAFVVAARFFHQTINLSQALAGQASPSRWTEPHWRRRMIRLSSCPAPKCCARAVTPISATSSLTAPSLQGCVFASIPRRSSLPRKRIENTPLLRKRFPGALHGWAGGYGVVPALDVGVSVKADLVDAMQMGIGIHGYVGDGVVSRHVFVVT